MPMKFAASIKGNSDAHLNELIKPYFFEILLIKPTLLPKVNKNKAAIDKTKKPVNKFLKNNIADNKIAKKANEIK